MCLSVGTSKALPTFAGETIELVDAGASILTWTRQTVIPIQITILSHPSRLTVTAVTGTTAGDITKPNHDFKIAKHTVFT